MAEKNKFYIVQASALPEVFLKVAEVKRLLSTGEAATVNDASKMVGISRSAFYKYRDAKLDDGKLTYVPKQKDATLYCTYNRYGSEQSGEWLPIFAFVDTPKAHSARLVLTTTNKDGETANHSLASMRNQQGYFLFQLHLIDLQAEEYWLVQQLIAGNYREYALKGTAEATLELYDKNGNLLETYHF